MEDVYQIGIRLALENGVSAGIATIAQDLAALDGAIAATTAHLQRLERVAGEVGRAATADLGSVRAPAPPQAQVPDAPTLALAAPLAAPSAPTESVSAPSVGAPPPTERGPTAVPPGGGAPLQGPIVSLMPASALTQEVVRPAAPPITPAAVPAGPLAPLPAPAPAAFVPPAASTSLPIAPPGDSAVTLRVLPLLPPPPAPPAEVRAPSKPSAQLQAAAPTTALTDRGLDGFAPTTPVTASIPLATSSPPASPPPRSREDAARLPAPIGAGGEAPVSAAPPPSARGARSPAALPFATVPPASVAPVRRDADAAGPTHGDVYLDGSRVGAWMADRFARAANRPPVGATGVDPMVAPGWPGSLQGQ